MANESVRIPVELEIQNLQGEVTRMRKMLSELKPNTKAFNHLEKAINNVDQKLITLENRSKQAFSSQNDINKFAKSFENVSFAMQDIYTEFQRLDLSESNLSPDDTTVKQIKELGKQIQKVNEKTKTIDKNIFKNVVSKETKQQIQAINKDFDFDTQSLEDGAEVIEDKMEEVSESIKKTGAEIEKLTKAGDALDKAYSSKDAERNKADRKAKKARNDVIKVKNIRKDRDLEKGREMAVGVLTSSQIAQIDEEVLKGLSPEAAEKRITDFFAKLTAAYDTESFKVQKELGEITAELDAKFAKITENDDQIEALKTKQAGLVAEQDKLNAAKTNISVGQQAAIEDLNQYQKEIDELRQKIALLTEELEKNNSVTRQADAGKKVVEKNQASFESIKNSKENDLGGQKEIENRKKELQDLIKQWFSFHEVVNVVKRAFSDAVNSIKELDSVMTEIAIVTDMTQKDLWDQVGTYSQVAQQYGVSTKGAYEVSMLWYQQGLQGAEVMDLTIETLKMAKIAGLDYATATDYMTVAIRGFKLEMEDARQVTDVYSALAAATASSTEEIAVAMSKTASSAEAVGSSFESTSAMIATMISVTREAPENIGSALKSIISRLITIGA